MKKSNKYSAKKYYVYSLLFFIIFFLFYFTLYLNQITLHAVPERWLLALIIFTFLLIWYFLTIDSLRNNLGILLFSILPFGVFVYLAYAPHWGLVAFAPIIFGMLAITWILLSFKKYPSLSKKTTSQKIKYCSRCVYIFAGFGCCFIMLAAIVQSETGVPAVTTPKNSPLQGYHSEEYMFQANAEDMCKLKQSTWKTLSEEEKLFVLQKVAHIEFNWLGLSNNISVTTERLSNSIFAEYNDTNYQITLNDKYIGTATSKQLLNAVCHESYHAYECQLLRLYKNSTKKERQLLCLYNAKEYENEFKNYIGVNENIEGYNNQTIEIHANAYAAGAVKDYFTLINQYLNQ